MEKFIEIRSIAAPWMLPNIDTDIISPMKRILRNMDEIYKYTFEPYRFVGGDGDAGIPEPSFILNKEQYKDAKIMIVGDNFGCGSSRETAPEAIAGMGIRCLISTGFGGIFYKNCFQQGILPIVFPKDVIEELVQETENGEFVVNLQQQTVQTPSQKVLKFQVGESQRYLLLEGVDNVGLTLKESQSIRDFEKADVQKRPWIYRVRS